MAHTTVHRQLRWVAIAIALAFSTAATAQDLPGRFGVTDVAPNDVLNLRERPDPSAPVMGTLPPDAHGIEVLSLSPDGRWGLVPRPEGRAWAAMRFLSPEPFDPRPVPRPLRCLGTEPFWSLRLSKDGAIFETPDQGERPLRQHGEAGGSTGAVAAFDAGGETLDLTVIRQACSDGMSDRPYGFSALVWNRGDTFLEGCCTLSSQ
ncbi:peptide-binding protein [Rubellimicrobium rubrum]|uniref:Peptide-binding protein n=1 Tax=Rubellimicrobium rubrum TaxID=2585369 RepID=A0A5C4MLE1_9RHOB|nr:SH3 domain-containing protein [Rubellimicrobium rubrum]TNC46425.1 peptide-binding protein [Rubellimicrobium rubrum]